MTSFSSITKWIPKLIAATGLLGADRKTHARRKLAYAFIYQDAETIKFVRPPFTWSAFVNDHVTSELYTLGHFQIGHIKSLASWLSEKNKAWNRGQVIINVGANIGATALPLHAATNKRIIAIEPVPATFALLAENIAANGLTLSIIAENYAVTSLCESVNIQTGRDSGRAELARCVSQIGDTPANASTLVDGRPLTSILEQLNLKPEEVSLVWSDTQGCEAEVIARGLPLWAKGVCLWCEFCPDLLQKQDGYITFLKLCASHFDAWLDKNELSIGRPASLKTHPIAELDQHGRWLGASGVYHTDILLIPRAPMANES